MSQMYKRRVDTSRMTIRHALLFWGLCAALALYVPTLAILVFGTLRLRRSITTRKHMRALETPPLRPRPLGT